jgi:hypothetical protein
MRQQNPPKKHDPATRRPPSCEKRCLYLEGLRGLACLTIVNCAFIAEFFPSLLSTDGASECL